MTRGISEEELIGLLDSAGLNNYEYAFVRYLLAKECKELNSWQPIETAPKDRHVLLHICVGPINCRNFVGNAYDTWPWKPTHWQELPEPPKE